MIFLLISAGKTPQRRLTKYYLVAARLCAACLFLASILASSISKLHAEDEPIFFRGLNLNGPAVTIDGNRWHGSQAEFYRCDGKAFSKPNLPLVPPTDPQRAEMLRSSRWGRGRNQLELLDVPSGTYTLFLYVWEDNDPEQYSVSVNENQVVANYNSQTLGHWQRLGPWYVTPVDGRITITSEGGAANFSGIELWRGRYDGIAQPISDEHLTFFEQRIRPLLVDRCYECHSAQSNDLAGELLVDSRLTLLRGGVSGAAVVPGDLDRSLLITAVRYGDELQMPPEEKLSEEQIADLERWIEMGAPDPRSQITSHAGKQIDIETARQFWSWSELNYPEVPQTADLIWPQSDIDRFVLAELERRGLQPAQPADKRTLIRRATYDLTGLPPTPSEIAQFLADDSPEAFSRVVDRLLASHHYGERWGRHWLDVVRYADTAGDNSDYPIPQHFRYRNWVIDAFNNDMPFDEFVRDQLAGDLRGGQTEQERQQRLIATGYLANARRFGSRVDDYPWHLTIEDTIDNLSRAFLGLSLSCARCHDHKFDPFTTRNYYGLYGIFASTKFPWPGIELDKRQRDLPALVSEEQLAELEKLQAERTARQSQLDQEVKRLKELLKGASEADKASIKQQVKQAEQSAQDHRSQLALFERAYAVSEAKPVDVAVQIKGEPSKPGDLVHRHFPELLGGGPLPESSHESGRRELAEWIVGKENPLSARVIANRVWHYHFGRGLVSTPNDFGKQGKPPTHPQLLDYLAWKLRNHGWSLKWLHREIMLSQVYQQSSLRQPKAIEIDANNDFLAGFRRQRLDAESIRDTVLVISGDLDSTSSGQHPFPPEHTWGFTQHKPFKAVYESNQRSVYLMTPRLQRHPYLAIFDGADPSTSTGQRTSSITPIQALYLLNDPWIHQQSELISGRILGHSDLTEARIQFAYELLFARPPKSDELEMGERFLLQVKELLLAERSSTVVNTDQTSSLQSIADTPKDSVESSAWISYVRSLIRLNEFIYLD